MKKTLTILSAVILAGVGFDGCKKGPNDPFISIHSRKARVVGEWKLTSGTSVDVDASVSPSTSTTSTDDGANQTVTDGTTSYIDVHTLSYVIDKAGTYKGTEHRVHTEVQTDFPLIGLTTTSTTTTDESPAGNWNFTSGVGDVKNKSQLSLIEISWTQAKSVRTVVKNGTNTINDNTVSSSDSQTYTGNPGSSEIWDLDELRNKKMVVKVKNSFVNSSGTSTSKDATYTFTQ